MSTTLYRAGVLALCATAGCSWGPPPVTATAGPPALATATAQSAELAPRPAVPRQPRPAGPVLLRPGHPDTYLVKPDDTLLQVAEVFLEEPWRWQEVWRPPAGAPTVQVYPGQIIELVYEQGQPRLRPVSDTAGVIRLSPQVRVESLGQPIATLPRNAVAGFLQDTIVVDRADWEAAPVIIGNYDDRVLTPAGATYIYAAGLDATDQRYYRVFHPRGEFRNPVTGEPLGFGGAFVGAAVLEKAEENQPAVLVMTDSRMEARSGDRLFPANQFTATEPYSFNLQAAPAAAEGQVISLLGENVVAGQYQSVAVNLGAEDGVKIGDMLGVYSTGRGLQTCYGYQGRLPTHKIATLMLYKVYDRVSYGLITAMQDVVKNCDGVGPP